MTVLDHELHHGDFHFTARIVAAVAVLGAVLTLLGVLYLAPSEPAPAPVTDYYGCASNDADCELQWMLENLTQIESPVLVLTPGSD